MFCSFVSLSLDSAKSEQPATEEVSNSSSNSSSSSLSESSDDRQIVMLVEEDEDEEPKQSTVTLLEEEVEEEEEKREEKARRDADRNQWESQAYCPFSSFSSLSLSCMVTLPELLHRWCSARLAKERLRSLRRRQLNTRTDVSPLVPTHTPSLLPAPTLPQEVLPLTETALEPELLGKVHQEGKTSGEVQTDVQVNAQQSDIYTPELNIQLEPSRTATIAPHSSSDLHSTLMRPTPTHEEKLLPPVKDEALDTVLTPPLQAASVPETQQAKGSTPTLSVSPPPPTPSPETASSFISGTAVKEQPVLSLPTASRPENLLTPPTELPAAVPPADSHTDSLKSATDGGGSKQKLNTDAPQIQGEQGSNLSQTGEPPRTEDSVDEELLNTNVNVQRTATDFYAELQNGGDYAGGTLNGNGMLLNGGAIHGSSQKESVFMRLNNRIKALEMNMSLSSRYLEELSQR